MPKRYLAFGGPLYYPGGGIDDLIADCDDVETARAALRAAGYGLDDDGYPDERNSWGHVYDTVAGKIIFGFNADALSHAREHSGYLAQYGHEAFVRGQRREPTAKERELAERWGR